MPTEATQQTPVPTLNADVLERKTKDSKFSRAACAECSRRKQKCNREWPCENCQKRMVPLKCIYNLVGKPSVAANSSRKRQLAADEPDNSEENTPIDGGSGHGAPRGTNADIELDSSESSDEGFETLGYTSSHSFALLDIRNETKTQAPKQFSLQVKDSHMLQRAIQVLPPRPYTDALVHNFLDYVNFHYYVIYPPTFINEYQAWCDDKANHQSLDISWTCLLLMVCACATQYTDEELQQKLEADLGETTQALSERYHDAARELHSILPSGYKHMHNVQQLLHSCYWFKSEARWVECWHVLNAAIREAQELGIHRESKNTSLTDFDREFRRRVWCVLDTWDWQISALLSRPMIIDRTDIDIGFPSLTLEDYTPSPLLHMKLQSGLIHLLAERFGLPKNVTRPADVIEYKGILEAWMDSFPKTYDFASPDRSEDEQRPWIKLHRHYLHTMAYSMTLDPIRAYMAEPMSRYSSAEELGIRNDGVSYLLRLMDAAYGFFNHVYPRDAKFHFVIFCIFDTAAVLCSAIMHDEDYSIPRRDEIFRAIDSAVDMLKRLKEVTQAAKISCNVLLRLWTKVRKLESAHQSKIYSQRKRAKVGEQLPPPPAVVETQSEQVKPEPSISSAHLSSTPVPAASGTEEPQGLIPPSSSIKSSDRGLNASTEALPSPNGPLGDSTINQDQIATDQRTRSSTPPSNDPPKEAPGSNGPTIHSATVLLENGSTGPVLPSSHGAYLHTSGPGPTVPYTGPPLSFNAEGPLMYTIPATTSGLSMPQVVYAPAPIPLPSQPLPPSEDYMNVPIQQDNDLSGNFTAELEQEMGPLATLWNYQSLDLGFVPPQR